MSIREEIRKQRESLKGKGFKAHVKWVWDYYKAWLIIIPIAAVVVLYLVLTLSGRKETAFSAVFFNIQSSDPGIESEIENDFGKRLDIDTARQEISINLSLYQTPGNPTGSSYDLATQTSVDALVSDHDLDVIVADTGNFAYYLQLGNFTDLRDVLSDEQLKQYSDDLYYVDMTKLKKTQEAMQDPDYVFPAVDKDEALKNEEKGTYVRPDPDDMDDPVPVGIFVTDAPYLTSLGLYDNRECVLGFVQGSRRTEQAVDFLAFLNGK